jgi:hypothetical protein
LLREEVMPYKDRETQLQYQRSHYLKYKATYDARSAKRAQEKNEYINEKKKAPCKDCLKTYHPACMDFHHKDPALKIKKIGDFRALTQKLRDEILKCVVICSNCHRLRHLEEDTLQ